MSSVGGCGVGADIVAEVMVTWSCLLGELQPCPRHLLSITLVKPDGNIAGIDDQPQLFFCRLLYLHPTHVHGNPNHLGGFSLA
jgi:hypothetical protein